MVQNSISDSAKGIKGGNGKSIVCDLYVEIIRLSGSDVSVFGAPSGNKSDPEVRMWMVLMSNVAPNNIDWRVTHGCG